MSRICDLSAKEYVGAASFHNETTAKFMEQAVKLLKEKPYEITTGCTEFGKTIKKRANSVLREIHLLSAYVRLKPYPEMLLVGHCSPEHQTCYSVAKSLAKRFDRFLILIFTPDNFSLATQRVDLPKFPEFKGNSENSIIKQIRNFSLEHMADFLPLDMLLEDGDFLWEKYYETQFLEQRMNPRMFKKVIPKHAMEKANMKIEKEFYEKVENKSKQKQTLDSFF